MLAPGVDAPCDAPEKAFKAGGQVYKPTLEERQEMVRILVNEYHMDGSEPDKVPRSVWQDQSSLTSPPERSRGLGLSRPPGICDQHVEESMEQLRLHQTVHERYHLHAAAWDLLPLIDPDAS